MPTSTRVIDLTAAYRSDSPLLRATTILSDLPVVRSASDGDPLVDFTKRCGAAAPLVAWNLGGAADFTPVAAIRNGVYDDALDRMHERPGSERPLLMIVSDRSEAVQRGLSAALTGAPPPTVPSFGTFTGEWPLATTAWRQLRLFDPAMARRLRRRKRAPCGSAIANASIQVSVATLELGTQPACLVYLHVEHDLALAGFIRPSALQVHLLFCTRRGTDEHSLQPSRGSLWRELSTLPHPLVWACDAEVFTPPADSGSTLQKGGSYGAPGLWLAPQG